MPFRFEHQQIPDIVLVEATAFEDERGLFMETYKHSEFGAAGIPWIFVQDNYSHSTRGVLRGLHYQKHPKAQGKLVGVLRGEIFDVAVDIRRGSPTLRRWVGVILSAANRRMLFVPPGFAHGFCVLSSEADVVYKVTAEYAQALDRGIVWNDPELGVAWPIQTPVLSPKDARLPPFHAADHNFVYEDLRQ
ncbi:MAG TPA: dTDP-4-dehydrorhamnose 3,5-epimerase [bacterium]|nr:dTDP-4-dehydrorhamnose 3,5-epimerase [bacterium]